MKEEESYSDYPWQMWPLVFLIDLGKAGAIIFEAVMGWRNKE